MYAPSGVSIGNSGDFFPRWSIHTQYRGRSMGSCVFGSIRFSPVE